MRSLLEARQIKGWMTQKELEWLRAVALSMPPGARFFELGSWRGKSTVALAVDGLDLTCVDTWQGSPGDVNKEIAAREDVYAVFCENMERLGLHPRVMKMDALDAARLVADNSLDAVFNDCDHHVYFARHFWAWFRKVRKGGLYCGHDYCFQFPEIRRVLRGSGLSFRVVPGTSIWCLIKP